MSLLGKDPIAAGNPCSFDLANLFDQQPLREGVWHRLSWGMFSAHALCLMRPEQALRASSEGGAWRTRLRAIGFHKGLLC